MTRDVTCVRWLWTPSNLPDSWMPTPYREVCWRISTTLCLICSCATNLRPRISTWERRTPQPYTSWWINRFTKWCPESFIYLWFHHLSRWYGLSTCTEVYLYPVIKIYQANWSHIYLIYSNTLTCETSARLMMDHSEAFSLSSMTLQVSQLQWFPIRHKLCQELDKHSCDISLAFLWLSPCKESQE